MSTASMCAVMVSDQKFGAWLNSTAYSENAAASPWCKWKCSRASRSSWTRASRRRLNSTESETVIFIEFLPPRSPVLYGWVDQVGCSGSKPWAAWALHLRIFLSLFYHWFARPLQLAPRSAECRMPGLPLWPFWKGFKFSVLGCRLAIHWSYRCSEW